MSAIYVSLVHDKHLHTDLPVNNIQNLPADEIHSTPTTETAILTSAPRMFSRTSEP